MIFRRIKEGRKEGREKESPVYACVCALSSVNLSPSAVNDRVKTCQPNQLCTATNEAALDPACVGGDDARFFGVALGPARFCRAQALEPLLNALAPKAYARLHKELSFELGEIYQDLADIKILRWVQPATVVAHKWPLLLSVLGAVLALMEVEVRRWAKSSGLLRQSAFRQQLQLASRFVLARMI